MHRKEKQQQADEAHVMKSILPEAQLNVRADPHNKHDKVCIEKVTGYYQKDGYYHVRNKGRKVRLKLSFGYCNKVPDNSH